MKSILAALQIGLIALFVTYLVRVEGFRLRSIKQLRTSQLTKKSQHRPTQTTLFSSKGNDRKSNIKTVRPKPVKELDRLTFGPWQRLVTWIEENGGLFRATINCQLEGWKAYPSPSLPYKIPQYTELMRIPKSLCLFSNPSDMKDYSYQEYLVKLLSSIDESQWRTRLGLILLSERTNPESKFYPYIMNLPLEIWGLPIFFDSQELQLLQEEKLIFDTNIRCMYLYEFAGKLFPPIYKSIVANKKNNPFFGRTPDINSFGWGFSCASSRALQRENILQVSSGLENEKIEQRPKGSESSPALLIPGIDVLSHSFQPNCVVIEDPKTNSYILYNTKEITSSDELTINYGSFSNPELVSNYGFTIYPNPAERFSFTANHTTINLARIIMGQTTNFRLFQEIHTLSKKDFRRQFQKPLFNGYHIGIGLTQNLYDDNSLPRWQTYWLKALQLYSPLESKQPIGPKNYFDKYYQFLLSASPLEGTNKTLAINSQIDKRLLALLRILYSRDEDELLSLGYDPYLIGERGSILPNPLQEAHVIKTVIGMLLYELRRFNTTLNTDLELLQQNQLTYKIDHPSLSYLQQENLLYFTQPLATEKEEVVEIHYDIQICHQMLREILTKVRLRQENEREKEQAEAKATLSNSTSSTKKSRKSKKQRESEVVSPPIIASDKILDDFFAHLEGMLMERLMLEPLKGSPTKGVEETRQKSKISTSSSALLEKYRLTDDKNQPLFASDVIVSDEELTKAALKMVAKLRKEITPVVRNYILNSKRLLQPLFNQLASSSTKSTSEEEITQLLMNSKLDPEQDEFLQQLVRDDITLYSDELRQVTTEVELYKFAYMIEKYLVLKQSEVMASSGKSLDSVVGYPGEYYDFIESAIEGILTQNLTMISQARESFLATIYDPRSYFPFDPSFSSFNPSSVVTSQAESPLEPVTYLTLSAPYDAVLNELGKDLPINIREAYRYRIRRKLFLYETIEQLILDYQV